MSATVALVTSGAHPDLAPDDRLLLPALTAVGLEPVARRWDDPQEEWAAHRAIVIRSSWDYHLRPAEFRAWLDRLDASGACVFNPLATLRWNLAKTYLRELERAGVATVPTGWVEQGAATTLAAELAARGWDDAVVKPVVSATAWETWRVGPAVTAGDETRFARLLEGRGVMLQPYLPGIEGGELSLIFLGGRYSHAVLKRPRPGDFRVQTDFGGTVDSADPGPELIAQAARAVAAAPGPCLYARVDGCVVDGGLWLMELELVEPVLFFARESGAADRLALALRAATPCPRGAD